MPALGVPIFLWKDYSSNWTAVPVDMELLPEEYRYGYGPTADRASRVVQSAIRFHVNHHDQYYDLPEIEPADPEIRRARFRVRPAYEHRDRNYPMGEPIELRLPMTVGKIVGDLLHCTVPTLDIFFRCFEYEDYQQLAAERVREILTGKTPDVILYHLPPVEWRIETVSVQIKDRSTGREEFKYPYLEKVARPLAGPGASRQSGAAYERDTELADLTRRLTDDEGSIVVVGEPGSGKSTLITSAVRAFRRAEKSDDTEKDERQTDRRFWRTSASRLVAGMRYLGQWQEQVENVISELVSFDGILCVENLIELVRRGGAPSDSIAAFLDSYIETGQLRIVGEATPHEMDAMRRLLPSFIDKFEVLHLEEMSPERARRAVAQLAGQIQQYRRIEVAPEVPSTAIQLFRRFQPYRSLPGAAAKFLEMLAHRVQKDRKEEIQAQDVIERFVQDTGLPEWLLRDEQTMTYDSIVESLGREVIGQDEASRRAAQTVVNFKAGMNPPGRPLGVLLFSGPTGVGKTQLTKTMANFLFGAGSDDLQQRIVRLDMSEYATPWSAERLIAKDDGTPSEMIAQIRRCPFSVVLLDEVEKASPEVFDILLGMFDEGRLTDRLGRTTNFQSTIIVMTSNLGASAGPSIGFVSDQTQGFVRAVREFFRPEFLGRIDAIIPFGALGRKDCSAIVRKEIASLATRQGLAERRIKIETTDRLVDQLVDVGFDPRYGARPLQRVIESQVVATVAHDLLTRPIEDGATLHLDWDTENDRVVCG